MLSGAVAYMRNHRKRTAALRSPQRSPTHQPLQIDATVERVSFNDAVENLDLGQPAIKTNRGMCANCGSCRAQHSPKMVNERLIGWLPESAYDSSYDSSFNSSASLDGLTGEANSGLEVCENFKCSSGDASMVTSDKKPCSCGETDCSCRCLEELAGLDSPGPRDLRFFPTAQDFRNLAGLSDEPCEEPTFCSPECRWSYRAREEYEMAKKYSRRRMEFDSDSD